MSGLQWIRRRQRRLARAVLPLVALAWLQVAAVPCVAAHQTAGLVAAAQHEAAGHGGHDLHEAADASSHGPCLYCPPDHGGHGTSSVDGSRCAFPHDPQVDARISTFAFAPPLAFTSFAVLPEPAQIGNCVAADRPEPVPRRSLFVSYCRFIE